MMNGQISCDVIEYYLLEEEQECQFLGLLALTKIDHSIHYREPCRDSILLGASWMFEIMFGNTNRKYDEFWMERHVFINLCNLVKQQGWLQDSCYIRLDEQIGMLI
ncbi:hypothetical protein NE237_024941 [Protea cynaroides]|uniref:DUF8040 domain-containing protein n=1 Tax=Protea cynaroides TaxID=273540 RepID=A0A9Q0K0W1_9MAGN|nr:hypothetical protein NE237_024941 [Protea cynaroides]